MASQILVLVLIMINNILVLVFNPGNVFPYTTGDESPEERGYAETPVKCIDAFFASHGFHDVVRSLFLGHQHGIVLVGIEDVCCHETRPDVRKPDRDMLHSGKLGQGRKVSALHPFGC